MKKKRALGASRDPEYITSKELSMSWFERWLSKKMQTVWNQHREEKIYAEPSRGIGLLNSTATVRSGKLDMQATMNFKMHHAENGWVIEVHGYDQRTDNSWSKLHLISDTEEFDKALAQIMTLEALRS
jgi:hypothetical protein